MLKINQFLLRISYYLSTYYWFFDFTFEFCFTARSDVVLTAPDCQYFSKAFFRRLLPITYLSSWKMVTFHGSMNEQNPITILLLETNCYEIHNCCFGSFCYSKKIQIDTIFQIEEKCGCPWISRIFLYLQNLWKIPIQSISK